MALLNEIAELRQLLLAVTDEKKKQAVEKQTREKKMAFSLLVERQKRHKK